MNYVNGVKKGKRYTVSEIAAIIYLLGCSFYDYRWKKIPVWMLVLGGTLGLTFRMVEIYMLEQTGWYAMFSGLLPGVCVTGIAWMSKDKIGCGDGLVLMVIGLFLRLELTILAAVTGLFITTLIGAGLVMAKRATFQTALPFIPFLTLGLVIALQAVDFV